MSKKPTTRDCEHLRGTTTAVPEACALFLQRHAVIADCVGIESPYCLRLVDRLQAENAALKAEVMSLADERDGFKAALVQALAEVERLTALRVEMFNAIVEYGAGDDLLYHALKAIMDAWFAGGA